ncbi:MAG: hypothetical protein ACRD59_17705 [Candidatus Acidiferrales bacterium]
MNPVKRKDASCVARLRALAVLVREGQRQVLALLEAVEDEFDATRYAQFFEDSKKVISHDSGSVVLGYSIAFLGLDLYRVSGPAKSPLLFPLLIAAVPLVDASLAVLRRLRQRRSPIHGDRNHFYDLLLARGWAARRVAVTCYGLTAMLVLTSWLALRLEFAQAFFLSISIAAGLCAAAVRLGSLRSRNVEVGLGKAKPRRDWRWLHARRARQKI